MTNRNINTGLTIIKASAGSGKTRRITFEYLNLALTSPDRFRHILAVTFTNKATAEMKSRIIDELEKIADVNAPHSDMLKDLQKSTGLTAAELQKRAHNLLKNMLHEYAHFNVSTIDHFFQHIIRALTQELSLSGGYRVQIDQGEVIESAVEQFLMNLRHDSPYMKVMLEFIDARMSDEKSWNVQYQLKKFTEQLFNEQVRYAFIKNKGSLNGRSSSAQIRKELNDIINRFQSKAAHWADEIETFLEKNQIAQSDIKGKSKNPVFSAINTIRSKKYEALPSKLDKLWKIEEWGHPKSDICDFVNSLANFFDSKIEQLEKLLTADYVSYLEAIALYKNIFLHSLASGLMEAVSDVLASHNLFMLSDAPVLLNLFTDNSDTPFIYEKTGHRFRHYMIDEFQDTSALQWQNFRPLIEESLAGGNPGNFIVGDVKQAIYRWRNGDWSLLHHQVADQISNTQYDPLLKNWRSREQIVNFNNAFFSGLIEIIARQQDEKYAQELKSMFSDVQQTIPEKVKNNRKGGFVYAEAIEAQHADTFRDEALQAVKTQIVKLKEEYNQNDICILVRSNRELTLAASYLINETPYRVVSAGSLSLAGSRMLQMIIAVMRYLADRQDLYLRTIVYLYNLKNEKIDINKIFTDDPYHYLPAAFTKRLTELQQMAATDLIGEIIIIFDLKHRFPVQDVFLSRFYNEIKKLTDENGSTLQNIIDWWDNTGSNLDVEISETSADSIRIMTIHQSKGLQFRYVFLPFAHWSPGNSPGILWLDGNAFNIETLHGGLYPASLKKAHTRHPQLKIFYDDERFAMLVDQINMLYVANTRAVEGLYIFYRAGCSDTNDVSNWINTMLHADHSGNLLNTGHFETDNVFVSGELLVADEFATHEKEPFQLNLHHGTGVALKSNLDAFNRTASTREPAALKGSLLHRIFANIITPADVPQAVSMQKHSGLINDEEALVLQQQITSWLQQSDIKDWFSDKYKILTEREIIVPQNTTRRPDRVIITGDKTVVLDYKFGQYTKERHQKQVSNYCRLFEQMNYESVVGYVWYPPLNRLISVRQ